MRSVPLPRSPLSVVYGTIMLLMAISVLILLILICGWISPFWSRTAILLQGIALLVVGMAYRWRPSWRLVLYPVLLAYMTYLWDTTLPPPNLPDGMVRFLLPCALLIGIAGDLWWPGGDPPGLPQSVFGSMAAMLILTRQPTFSASTPISCAPSSRIQVVQYSLDAAARSLSRSTICWQFWRPTMPPPPRVIIIPDGVFPPQPCWRCRACACSQRASGGGVIRRDGCTTYIC